MLPERDEQEQGNDTIKVGNSACKRPPNTRPIMPRAEPDTAMSRPTGAKTARSITSHGTTARKKIAKMRNAQPLVSSSAAAGRAPGGSTAIAGGKIDNATMSAIVTTSAVTDQAKLVASVTSKACSAPRKSSRNPARTSNANSQAKKRRNAVGFCDLVKNDETKSGDQNRRHQKRAQRRLDERYRRAQQFLLRDASRNELIEHGDCQNDEKGIDDERTQPRQHARHSRYAAPSVA